MKTALFLMLGAGIVLLPLYLWYWNIFRPVVITRLRYRLFGLRDKLRLHAIEALMCPEDKQAYPVVEAACNRALNVVLTLTLADLFWFKPDKATELESKRDLALIENASKQIRDIRSSAFEAVMAAMLANSPGFIVLIVPLSLLIVCSYWFWRTGKIVNRLRERLWEFVASSPSPTPS